MGIDPDYGPSKVDEKLGICTIGAVPLIVNYNILVRVTDLAAGAQDCDRARLHLPS
jgi:glutamate formiminotransferase